MPANGKIGRRKLTPLRVRCATSGRIKRRLSLWSCGVEIIGLFSYASHRSRIGRKIRRLNKLGFGEFSAKKIAVVPITRNEPKNVVKGTQPWRTFRKAGKIRQALKVRSVKRQKASRDTRSKSGKPRTSVAYARWRPPPRVIAPAKPQSSSERNARCESGLRAFMPER